MLSCQIWSWSIWFHPCEALITKFKVLRTIRKIREEISAGVTRIPTRRSGPSHIGENLQHNGRTKLFNTLHIFLRRMQAIMHGAKISPTRKKQLHNKGDFQKCWKFDPVFNYQQDLRQRNFVLLGLHVFAQTLPTLFSCFLGEWPISPS